MSEEAGGAPSGREESVMEAIPFSDERNHGWRAAYGVYALGEDIELQMLEARIEEALKELELPEDCAGGHGPGSPSNAGVGALAGRGVVGTGLGHMQSRDDQAMRKRKLLLEEKHRERLDDEALALAPSSWRLRERMKTVSVALVLALNIGTDPPDVVKTDPCARLECWIDPATYTPTRALELIARNLQSQFEFWQPRARYKYTLDPSVDAVKKLCTSMRRNAKEERVLFHFNGHGVPRPTANGEIWVFNADYTQYIPLSIYDLVAWTGFPAIYTLDCSGAGLLLPHFLQQIKDYSGHRDSVPGRSASSAPTKSTYRTTSLRHSVSNECIVLLACGASEVLPSTPDFPADVFTACLTTPIKIALRWFVISNKTTMGALNVSVDMIDQVPGKLNDRKTPLGELNWIFTAITDTIAWTLLPRHLFRKLFRQDILVASLFRNFLLAERILKSVHCTPQSHPSLPSAWQHHLWQAWDMAVENCLTQLPFLVPQANGGEQQQERAAPRESEGRAKEALRGKEAAGKPYVARYQEAPHPNGSVKKQPLRHWKNSIQGPEFVHGALKTSPRASSASGKLRENASPDTAYVYRQSDFFTNQLTSFEVWLTSGENQKHRQVPEQLPIVLQLSLSSVHRLRALDLLARFLNLGSWAVSLALSVGIFPYVNKLLMSPDEKIRPVLIHIWSKILALDSSCQSDLVKESNSSSYSIQNSRNMKQSSNEGGHLYFLSQLRRLRLPSLYDKDPENQVGLAREVNHGVKAAFVVCVIVNGDKVGQRLCMRHEFLEIAKQLLLVPCKASYVPLLKKQLRLLKEWLCFGLAKLLEKCPTARHRASANDVPAALFSLLDDDSIDVVQAAVYALGHLLGPHHEEVPEADKPNSPRDGTHGMHQQRGVRGPIYQASLQRQAAANMSAPKPQVQDPAQVESLKVASVSSDCVVVNALLRYIQHGSPVVRRELMLAIGRFVVDPRHASLVQLTAHELELTQKSVIKLSDPEDASADSVETSYHDLMAKLSRMLGEHAESYMRVWLGVKRLAKIDPFPAVSRVARVVLEYVQSGVQERIDAIRSRAGLRPGSQGDSESDVGSFDAKTQERGGVLAAPPRPPRAPLSRSPFPANTTTQNTGPSPSTEYYPRDPEHGVSTPVADDLVVQLGIVSSLLERRVKYFSKPSMVNSRGSWEQLEESDDLFLDPLGPKGQLLLSFLRQNFDASRAAQVLCTKGAQWAGTKVPSNHLPFPNRAAAPDLDPTGSTRNTFSNVRGAEGSDANASDSLSSTESHNSYTQRSASTDLSCDVPFPVSKIDANVSGFSSSSRRNAVVVPAPSERVLKRLEKLVQMDDSMLDDELWALTRTAGLSSLSSDKEKSGMEGRKNAESLLEGEDDGSLAVDHKLEEHVLFEHGQDMCSKVLFHPFEPALVVFGQLDDVSVWDFPPEHASGASCIASGRYSKSLLCQFSNSTSVDVEHMRAKGHRVKTNARTTSGLWLNETSEPLLCIGSDDGNVRVWRDALESPQPGMLNGVRLVTAWSALPELKAGKSGPGMVLSWQPRSKQLVCGGKTSTVSIWDVAIQKELGRVKTCSKREVTCVASYGATLGLGGFAVSRGIDYGMQGFVAGGDDSMFLTGDGDGVIRLFDKRVCGGGKLASSVATLNRHRSWVVHIDVPRSSEGRVIVSGSVSGEISLWDIRRFQNGSPLFTKQLDEYYGRRGSSASFAGVGAAASDQERPLETLSRPVPPTVSPDLAFDALRAPMTAMAHHAFAPVFAGGSHHKYIHLFNTGGEMLSTIRYHDGFFRQRISPVSALSFHPYKMLLAAGSVGPTVSIYAPP